MDLSNTYAGQIKSRYLGLKEYTLKNFLKGTFCLSVGKKFGCGVEEGMSYQEEVSLQTKLGPDFANLNFGTKFVSDEKWSYRSKDCEYCDPEICYPDSTLKLWTCKNKIAFWKMETIEQEFETLSRGELNMNCIQNDPRCNCQTEISQSNSRGGKVSDVSGTIRSVVMTPGKFTHEAGKIENMELSPMDQINFILTDCLFSMSELQKKNYALGISNPNGSVNWLYPSAKSQPQISLLSPNGMNRFINATDITADNLFPVLAVTQHIPNYDSVEISITFIDPKGSDKLLVYSDKVEGDNVQIKKDLFLIIWKEIDLKFAEVKIEKGTESSIEIKVKDLSGVTLTYLREHYFFN